MAHKTDNASHVPHLGTTTNAGNVYSITSTKVIGDGAKFSVKFNTAATDTATLNISSDGTDRTLKKPDGNNFKPKAGVYSFIRDGANFQLLGEGGEYGTAGAAQTLTGYTLGTEDGVINGTMPSNGDVSADISTKAQQITVQSGYTSGGVIEISAAEQAKIIAENIKNGVTILGQSGSLNPRLFASGTGAVNASGYARISGLSFTPRMIWLQTTSGSVSIRSFFIYEWYSTHQLYVGNSGNFGTQLLDGTWLYVINGAFSLLGAEPGQSFTYVAYG